MRRISADGRGDVCPVDAVVAADADPAVADRAVRAGWDFHFRMVRIDPCRIDFHIDDFSSADRRRRVRLAWSDRVHADAHVSLIERQEAAGKVDFYALVFKGRLLPSFLSVVSALVSALAGVILTWTGASFQALPSLSLRQARWM